MSFNSSLQLFLMCVWEAGNSFTFSFKNVGTWLTCHPQGEQGSSVLKTFYLWDPGLVLQLWILPLGGQSVDLKFSLHCCGKMTIWTSKAFHPHLFAFIPCYTLCCLKVWNENPLNKLSEDITVQIQAWKHYSRLENGHGSEHFNEEKLHHTCTSVLCTLLTYHWHSISWVLHQSFVNCASVLIYLVFQNPGGDLAALQLCLIIALQEEMLNRCLWMN